MEKNKRALGQALQPSSIVFTVIKAQVFPWAPGIVACNVLAQSAGEAFKVRHSMLRSLTKIAGVLAGHAG